MIDKARITRRVNLSSLVKWLVVVSTTALLVSGLIWPIPTTEAQSGSISGHVYDDAGNPISGADVWADPYAGGQGQPPTTTAADGSYTITGLGSGDYKVGARAPNHAEEFYDGQFDYGQAARVTVNDTDTTTGIDFALDPGGTISGTVDSGGTPLPNMDVGASTDWGGTGAQTDSSGNYTIQGVPYGEYRVSAGGGGSGYLRQFWQNKSHSDEADLVTVSADTPSPKDINFSLERGGSISGTVKDPNDAPVQGAWASVHNQDWTFNEGSDTDATGAFSITAPVGTYVLEVNPPQGSLWAAPNPQTVNLTSIDTPLDVGIVYLTRPLLTGKVTAPDGTTPIRDAWVEAYTEDWSVHKGSNTDDQGIFRIGGLSSGTYTLHANPPQQGTGSDYTGSVPQAVTVAEGSTNDVGVVRLTNPQIFGKVTLPDGTTGVPDAWVEAHTLDWTFSRGSNSDSQGDFKLGGLSPDTYWVKANPPPGPAYAQYTESDEEEVEITATSVITLTAPLRLNRVNVRGRVLDPDGNPAQWAGVDVYNDDFSVHKGTGTDDNGNFSFGGLAAGSYMLEIHLPWGTSGWVSPPPTSFAIVPDGDIVELGDIAFITATKFVQGAVTRSNPGEGVANVEVHANKRGATSGWANTTTDTQGNYSLALSSGSWDVMIGAPPDDPNVDWVYLGQPEMVSFADDQTQETKTVDFTVVTADAHVTGSVRGPDGEELIPWSIWVDVRDLDGRGNGRSLSSDGSFDIPVVAGTYNAWVHVDEQQYPTWGSPQIAPFSVASGESHPLGELRLVAKNSFIRGTVTRQSDGQGVPGVEVHAWKPEEGGWGHTTTAADGSYSLALVAGTWEVGIMPPADSNYVSGQPPQRVEVADGQTVTDVNFQLVEAAGTIQGTVQDSGGNLLTDVDGWAYARQGTDPRPVAGGELQNGTFNISVPAGTYNVGASLPPGSDYTPSGEEEVTVSIAELGSPAAVAMAYKSQVEVKVTVTAGETIPVTIVLLRNDAKIRGQFFTDEARTSPAVGLEGEVFAMSGIGGAWVGTRIDPTDGSYELDVAAGTWNLGYWLESEDYVNSPPPESRVTAASGEEFVMNFTVAPADSSIRGRILKPDGNPLFYAWAWAHRERTETSARIDTGDESRPPDGGFNIRVPAGTYDVGGHFPEEAGYIQPDFQEVTVDASNPAAVTLQFRDSDAAITGTVYYHDQAGNVVYGPWAWVWGWSENGAHTEALTDADGNYRLNVNTGSTWHLGACYQYDDSLFYDTTTDYTVVMTGASATQDMEIFPNTAMLPDAISVSFDATNPMVLTLSDGTEINIPAGAIATSGMVKVVITPMVEELANTLTARPFGFGYAMYAFDSDDNQITGTLNRNVTISFYYTEDELTRRGVSEDGLSPSYFSTTTNSWTNVESFSVDRDANRLTVQINHFSTWALTTSAVTPVTPEDHYEIYLPLILKNY